MGNYEQLKQAVSSVIKDNGNMEITGDILQNTLLSIISTVGGNATFAGIATPSTNPGTPDQNVFYIASEPGVYTNFGGVNLIDQVLIFINTNGQWVAKNTNIPLLEAVTKAQTTANEAKTMAESNARRIGEVQHTVEGNTQNIEVLQNIENYDVLVSGNSEALPTADSVDIRIKNLNINGPSTDVETINIPAATESKAGVMSTADKKILDYYNSSRGSYLEANISYSPDDVSLGSVRFGVVDDIETDPITLRAATTEQAGVMSAQDKKTLNIVSDMKYQNMSYILYSELKNLRDNSQLVKGKLYRITDFVTTVANDPEARSAGHPFDIIVLATSPNTLSENALAAKHEGDTYFANSNLDAWEIKYDLDNDTTKYAWADATNGKGVIYHMKDEFNNECPYDFKNVLFKRYKLKNKSGLHLADSVLKYEDYDDPAKQAFINWKNFLDSSMGSDNVAFYYTRGVYTNGYLVSGADIYGYGDYESYDGGALVFDENSGGNYVAVDSKYDYFDIIAEVEDTNGEWFYTFSKKITAADAAVDASLDKLTKINCYCNSIKEYIESKLYYLNNNIFIVLGSVGNICRNNFNTNCYFNTFGKECYNNTFGNSCYYNTFGNSCNSNIFGNSCNSNIFGNSCNSNTFENNCFSNTFGDICNSNTFGNSCCYNTFGSECHFNTFGKECYNNTFGNSCNSNTFENNCCSNTFGDFCIYNQIKSGNNGISFKLYTTGLSMEIQYLTIYKVNDNTTIPANLITIGANYSQVLGLNSSGEIVCKPALD